MVIKNMLALLCAIWFVGAQIIPFTTQAVGKIFNDRREPTLFLFVTDDEISTNARSVFEAYDETKPETVLVISEPVPDAGIYGRLAQYLGVDPSDAPCYLYLGPGDDKYYLNGQQSTVEELIEFVGRARIGTAHRHYKSAPIPHNNIGYVKILVGQNFNEQVLQSDKEVLINFNAPYCIACSELASHYFDAATRLITNPNLMLATMDYTVNQIPNLSISEYPTLKFWSKDKSADPIDYSGEMTVLGIISWIKEHTEFEWVEIDLPTQEEVSQLKKRAKVNLQKLIEEQLSDMEESAEQEQTDENPPTEQQNTDL